MLVQGLLQVYVVSTAAESATLWVKIRSLKDAVLKDYGKIVVPKETKRVITGLRFYDIPGQVIVKIKQVSPVVIESTFRSETGVETNFPAREISVDQSRLLGPFWVNTVISEMRL